MSLRKLQVPEQQFRSAATLQSANLEKRTIEVVWSTGHRGLRSSWGERYFEELSMDPAHVSLSRLNGGASVLNTHAGWDLRDVLGTVEEAWLEGGKGIARLRLSVDEAKKGMVDDILAGTIRNVSIGYNIRKLVEIGRENDIPILRAEDWEPFEISFVPTGFDPLAASRSSEGSSTICEVILKNERTSMTPEELEAKRVAEAREAKRIADEQAAQTRAAIDAALGAERSRVRSITELCTTHKVAEAEKVRLLSDDKISIEDARAFVLDSIAKDQTTRATSTVSVSSDFNEKSHLIRGAEEAILSRIDARIFKPTELSQKFRGASLMDMVKDVLEAEGVRTRGLTPNEICTRGFHTTSDFGNLLSGSINKILSNAYSTASSDFGFFTQPVGVSDYKQVGHYAMSEAPALLEVKEHAEYKRGSVNTKEEFMALKKYGRIFAVTRETIINDDLNALANWPRKWAFSAAQLQASLAYGVLTANANMQDGQPLFSTAHKNVLAGGSTAILNEANLAAAITLLENQTGFSSDDGDTQYLGLRAKYLVVGTAQKFAAQKLVSPINYPQATTNVNLFSYLEVKSDPRITGTKWYVMADNALLDSVAMLYLNGEQGPQLDERRGFDVDGIEYKVRLDTGAKALDTKFAVYSPGV